MPVWTMQSCLSQDLYEPERPVPKMWTKTPAFHEDRSSVHLSGARIRCHSLGHYIDDCHSYYHNLHFHSKDSSSGCDKKKEKNVKKKKSCCFKIILFCLFSRLLSSKGDNSRKKRKWWNMTCGLGSQLWSLFHWNCSHN